MIHNRVNKKTDVGFTPMRLKINPPFHDTHKYIWPIYAYFQPNQYLVQNM